jgi:hypothetical protein
VTVARDHADNCPCAACAHERNWENLTSEFLPEVTESQPATIGQRVATVIRDAFEWAVLVGLILLLAQCWPVTS